MKVFQRLGLAVLAILILAACSDGGGPAPSPESPTPTDPGGLAASIVTSATSVFFDEEVTLEVQLAGANIADATVSWSINGGTLSTTSGAKTVWTAPRDEGTFTVTVDVDVDGDSLTDTADIRVSPDPNMNYLVVQASHGQTKRAADGAITTTFGLEVDLSAQVIGPDAGNLAFQWELVSGGGSFTGFTNEPTATWKTPAQIDQARIRATASAGGETLVEEIVIDVIKPLGISKIIPENPSIGMGNEVPIEVVFDGYFSDEAQAEWGYSVTSIGSPNPNYAGAIIPHSGERRFATFRAPKVERTDRFSVSARHDGRTYETMHVDVEVGICDDGDFNSSSNPCQIQNVHQLQAINTDAVERTKGHYVLTDDIDASATETWNQGAGFEPIGRGVDNRFTGTFDGANFTISGLTIERNTADEANIGLFGTIIGGTVQNLVFEQASVKGIKAVGVVSGSAAGATVTNIHIRDNSVVNGRWRVGGVTGFTYTPSNAPKTEISDITITESNIGLTGAYQVPQNEFYGGVGGVVGLAVNTALTNVETTKSEISGGSDHVGGIAGLIGPDSSIHLARVSESEIYMTTYSNVSRESSNLGGIVGLSEGELVDVEVAHTDIIGSGLSVGGVVGKNGVDGSIDSGLIRESRVTRSKTYFSGDAVGGFVSINEGIITDGVVDDVQVKATNAVGGFVGINEQSGEISRGLVTNSEVLLDHSLQLGVGEEDANGLGGFVLGNEGRISRSSVQNTEIYGSWDDTAGFAAKNISPGKISESFVYLPDFILHGSGDHVGGFVAFNQGEVRKSYAILDQVTGSGNYIGGFIAHNSGAGAGAEVWVEQSYAHTDVKAIQSGSTEVGGFIGQNDDLPSFPGRIRNSFWSSQVAVSYPHSYGGNENNITAVNFEVESTFTQKQWDFNSATGDWIMPSTSNPGPHTPDLVNNSRY